jgi:hypothetical protein
MARVREHLMRLAQEREGVRVGRRRVLQLVEPAAVRRRDLLGGGVAGGLQGRFRDR